jgi:hypothetical protein
MLQTEPRCHFVSFGCKGLVFLEVLGTDAGHPGAFVVEARTVRPVARVNRTPF